MIESHIKENKISFAMASLLIFYTASRYCIGSWVCVKCRQTAERRKGTLWAETFAGINFRIRFSRFLVIFAKVYAFVKFFYAKSWIFFKTQKFISP